jgi:hypothetical protein
VQYALVPGSSNEYVELYDLTRAALDLAYLVPYHSTTYKVAIVRTGRIDTVQVLVPGTANASMSSSLQNMSLQERKNESVVHTILLLFFILLTALKTI